MAAMPVLWMISRHWATLVLTLSRAAALSKRNNRNNSAIIAKPYWEASTSDRWSHGMTLKVYIGSLVLCYLRKCHKRMTFLDGCSSLPTPTSTKGLSFADALVGQIAYRSYTNNGQITT